jgi:hypothetical protein
VDPDEEISTMHALKDRYPHYWEIIETAVDEHSSGGCIDLSAFELDSVIRSLVDVEIKFVNEDEEFTVTIDLADHSWEAEYVR